ESVLASMGTSILEGRDPGRDPELDATARNQAAQDILGAMEDMQGQRAPHHDPVLGGAIQAALAQTAPNALRLAALHAVRHASAEAAPAAAFGKALSLLYFDISSGQRPATAREAATLNTLAGTNVRTPVREAQDALRWVTRQDLETIVNKAAGVGSLTWSE